MTDQIGSLPFPCTPCSSVLDWASFRAFLPAQIRTYSQAASFLLFRKPWLEATHPEQVCMKSVLFLRRCPRVWRSSGHDRPCGGVARRERGRQCRLRLLQGKCSTRAEAERDQKPFAKIQLYPVGFGVRSFAIASNAREPWEDQQCCRAYRQAKSGWWSLSPRAVLRPAALVNGGKARRSLHN